MSQGVSQRLATWSSTYVCLCSKLYIRRVAFSVQLKSFSRFQLPLECLTQPDSWSLMRFHFVWDFPPSRTFCEMSKPVHPGLLMAWDFELAMLVCSLCAACVHLLCGVSAEVPGLVLVGKGSRLHRLDCWRISWESRQPRKPREQPRRKKKPLGVFNQLQFGVSFSTAVKTEKHSPI